MKCALSLQKMEFPWSRKKLILSSLILCGNRACGKQIALVSIHLSVVLIYPPSGYGVSDIQLLMFCGIAHLNFILVSLEL